MPVVGKLNVITKKILRNGVIAKNTIGANLRKLMISIIGNFPECNVIIKLYTFIARHLRARDLPPPFHPTSSNNYNNREVRNLYQLWQHSTAFFAMSIIDNIFWNYHGRDPKTKRSNKVETHVSKSQRVRATENLPAVEIQARSSWWGSLRAPSGLYGLHAARAMQRFTESGCAGARANEHDTRFMYYTRRINPSTENRIRKWGGGFLIFFKSQPMWTFFLYIFKKAQPNLDFYNTFYK